MEKIILTLEHREVLMRVLEILNKNNTFTSYEEKVQEIKEYTEPKSLLKPNMIVKDRDGLTYIVGTNYICSDKGHISLISFNNDLKHTTRGNTDIMKIYTTGKVDIYKTDICSLSCTFNVHNLECIWSRDDKDRKQIEDEILDLKLKLKESEDKLKI